jgi:transposase
MPAEHCPPSSRRSALPRIFARAAKAIREEAGFRARRRVVERTHGWMNRFRRILVRWEKLPETFMATVHFACGMIAWRAVGLLE